MEGGRGREREIEGEGEGDGEGRRGTGKAREGSRREGRGGRGRATRRREREREREFKVLGPMQAVDKYLVEPSCPTCREPWSQSPAELFMLMELEQLDIDVASDTISVDDGVSVSEADTTSAQDGLVEPEPSIAPDQFCTSIWDCNGSEVLENGEREYGYLALRKGDLVLIKSERFDGRPGNMFPSYVWAEHVVNGNAGWAPALLLSQLVIEEF